ncbi:COG1361 S-layer family protein [Candidatus Altiarchaeota archaeon]
MDTKKVIAIFAVLIMAAGYVTAEIRIDSVTTDPSHIEAGDEVDVYVKFHNEPSAGRAIQAGFYSPKAASETQFLGDDPDVAYWVELTPKDGISRENIILQESRQRVGRLFTGESWTTPFNLKIKNSAPPANYKMEVAIIKTSLVGLEGEVAASTTVSFEVKGTPRFNLEATNSIALGSEGEIQVNVKNVGGDAASHVTLGVNLTTPFTPLDSSVTNIGTLKPGEQKTVVFPVSVDTSAMAKAYPVIVGLMYTGPTGAEQTSAYIIGVLVTGEPNIEVGIDDAGELKAGDTGDIIVSVVNGDYVDAKFLGIELLPGENFKVKSISKVYIGAVDSDDFETVDYTLKINKDVSAEEIPLSFKVSYKKEGSSQDYVKEYTVNLPLISEAELKEEQENGGYQQQLTMALMVIPAVIIAYLVLWLLLKIIGAITRFLDRHIFNRQK